MRTPNVISRRRFVVRSIDIVAVLAAYALAFLLRFDFALDPFYLHCMITTAPFAVLTYLLAAFYFGGLRYHASFADAVDVLKAASAAALIHGMIFIPAAGGKFPRSILFLWPILSLFSVAGLHAIVRRASHYWRVSLSGRGRRRAAVIVGVGDLGERIYQGMRSDETIDYRIKAFFDDDSSKWGSRMHGVPVIGGVPALAAFLRRVPVEEIVIAVGHRRGAVVSAVADALRDVEKRPDVRIVPNLDEMLSSQKRIDPRKVKPADLLNRRVVSLDAAGITREIEGKVVLVTGAGGTIGGELSRQIANHKPAKVVLLDNHATALFYREAELRDKLPGSRIVAVLGDVRDRSLLDRIFQEERPQIVFHAAAHKHVHQLETNIHEGVSNNLLGTYYLARAADRHRVETFILISTDKAVRPSCVMGATKRAAEIVVSNFAHASKTRFAAVRFGNVLGSSGSVLKIFQEQIENRQPITLTHPDASRYFMTVEEAVGLVLQASALAKGGEIFVLKMGEQIRIMDIARNLILFSGLEPGRDVEIRVVGLKAGEKMTEELIEDAAGEEQSEHPEILVLRSENKRVAGLADKISRLSGMSLLPRGTRRCSERSPNWCRRSPADRAYRRAVRGEIGGRRAPSLGLPQRRARRSDRRNCSTPIRTTARSPRVYEGKEASMGKIKSIAARAFSDGSLAAVRPDLSRRDVLRLSHRKRLESRHQRAPVPHHPKGRQLRRGGGYRHRRERDVCRQHDERNTRHDHVQRHRGEPDHVEGPDPGPGVLERGQQRGRVRHSGQRILLEYHRVRHQRILVHRHRRGERNQRARPEQRHTQYRQHHFFELIRIQRHFPVRRLELDRQREHDPRHRETQRVGFSESRSRHLRGLSDDFEHPDHEQYFL